MFLVQKNDYLKTPKKLGLPDPHPPCLGLSHKKYHFFDAFRKATIGLESDEIMTDTFLVHPHLGSSQCCTPEVLIFRKILKIYCQTFTYDLR